MAKFLTISIFLSMVLIPNISNSQLTSSLNSALIKYCIPKNNSSCSSSVVAFFNGSKCECPADNMFYNQTTRICETCSELSFVTDRVSTECTLYTCFAGNYLMNIKSGCPAGFYRHYN